MTTERESVSENSPGYREVVSAARRPSPSAKHATRGFLALACLPSLFASTFYVAPGGSDSNPGTVTSPFATVNKAAGLASGGDTVYLRGGSYHQTVYLSKPGTATSPITISGYPGETAIIDGQNNLPSDMYGALLWVATNYVVVQDLTVQNSYGIGLLLQGNYNQALRVKSYKNYENGILVSGGANNLVASFEVYYNAKRNEFGKTPTGYWSTGLSAARGSVNNTTLRGNKVWNNWGEGLSTFESTYTTLEDNIVWDNYSANVYLSDTTHALFQRNMVYMTPGNALSGYGGAQSNIMMGDEVYNPPSSDNTIINNFGMGGDRTFYWWQGLKGGGLVNTLIANNTFVNAGKVADVQIATGTHSNSVFKNNISVQTDSLPVAYFPPTSAGLSISNNVWSKTPPAIASGTGDFVGDPLLAKTGSTGAGALSPDWFKLLAGSPAVRRAVSLPQVTVDFFKTTRGSTPDAGGHQYTTGDFTDTVAPSVPSGLTAVAVSASQIKLSWVASTDNVAVTGYYIYRGATQIASVTGTSYQDAGLTASTAYTYAVAAFDAAGNVAKSGYVSATTSAGSDTAAPSEPTGLTASAVSSSQIALSWAAATDNIGVVGYQVFRGGVQIAKVSTRTFQDSGLSASTSYTYTVAAYDAAGNVSAQSSPVSAVTQASSATNVPISIRVTYPTYGSTLAKSSTIQLAAQASDSKTVTAITWTVDGVAIPGTTTATSATTTVGSAVWVTPSTAGSHKIVATAIDTTRTTATSTVIVQVK